MGKKCAKCGYIQPKGASGYEPECPKCGADYLTGAVTVQPSATPKRAEAAKQQPNQSEPSPAPPGFTRDVPEQPSAGMIAACDKCKAMIGNLGANAPHDDLILIDTTHYRTKEMRLAPLEYYRCRKCATRLQRAMDPTDGRTVWERQPR